MRKQLRFNTALIPLVLSGEKTATWRLWDEKDLTEKEIVEFIERGTNKRFATARLIKIIEKAMGDLTEDDKKGHEKYLSEKTMYKVYTRYYGRLVTPETVVKIIHFILV